MKKVIIIDDEPLARTIVKEYLLSHPDLNVVSECGNGFDGVKAIREHRPDLVLLDIQMPRINGFEMLELLEEMPDVIFATAFDEYAIKAFDNNAIDYLLKPFSKERFDRSIEKWRRGLDHADATAPMQALMSSATLQPEEKNRIVVRNQSEISIVPVDDVHYLEAYDDYVKIFTANTFYLKKKTMNYYEQVLDPAHFFRIHRSFIINLKELNRIEAMEKNSYVALLKSGKKIPVSRASYSKLKEVLGI